MNIPKLAKRTRKKLKTITTDSVIKYLSSKKFTTLYIGTSQGDATLVSLGLLEYADRKAFTYSQNAKYVFVQNDLSDEEKRYLLLHELAHIELGHTDGGQILNSLQKERQAETYAHYIENPENSVTIGKLLVVLIALFATFSLLIDIPHRSSPNLKHSSVPVNSVIHNETEISNSQIISEELETYVFITPTGNHYHKKHCGYLYENAIEVKKTDIENKYQPCSVCYN